MSRANTTSRPVLSIVIPTVSDTAALERTLVSVLENRPAATEIVVPLGCDYADPWNIREEVRFVQAPAGAGLVGCTNLGIAASTAPLIHVLAAGLRATPGWTDRPVERLASGAAAVVPLGIAADSPARIVSAGIGLSRGGRRIDLAPSGRGRRRDDLDPATLMPAGPTLEAGFWRADVLAVAGPGFPAACGDSHADADLAAALASLGAPVVLEPESRVVWSTPRQPIGAFAAGNLAERVFWRSLARGSLVTRLAAHAVEVARDSIVRAPLGTLPMLAGRFAAFLQYGDHVARVRRLRAVARQAEEAERPTLRIDDPHHAIRPRGRVSTPALKRSA
jgi:hypothetical protein